MDTAFMFVAILIFVAVAMIIIALLCRACSDYGWDTPVENFSCERILNYFHEIGMVSAYF